jgi:hypothetical protein
MAPATVPRWPARSGTSRRSSSLRPEASPLLT